MRCDAHDHQSDQTRVGVTVHFDRDELTARQTPFGLVLTLAGLKSGGEPGAPALPRTQVRIAVPTPYWPRELTIDAEEWVTVVEGGGFVAPAQPLRVGAAGPSGSRPAKKAVAKKAATTKTSAKKTPAKKVPAAPVAMADVPSEPVERDDCHCASDCSCRGARDPFRPPLTEGFPAPAVVPPDVEKYDAAVRNPAPPARAVRIETIGTTHIAVVELCPIRINANGGLELCTSLRLGVEYVGDPPLGDKEQALAALREQLGRDIDPERVVPRPLPTITGRREAETLRALAADAVLNSQVVAEVDRWWPTIQLPSEYLVVTDDRTWDAATITPGVPVPGMVAAFQRLAAAKRARGISARVVTITDIVDGRYGDVRTGSRDLQEVIRRFLKIARERWGVSWLLLGGDTSVVPVRSVAGAMLGHIAVDSKSAPDDNRSFWTGSFLKMKVVNPGDWWFASAMNQLVRPDTGALIPYDGMGTSSATSPGWYFTDSDWSTRSASPTDYVRVNGPAGLVNASLQFLYAWNTLPTDFYYASLSSWLVGYRTIDLGWFTFQEPYVYLPEHDWDALDNGIYGQHRNDGTDLDGMHLATDLSVGRAPVDSAVQANTFVDKVLTYEGIGSAIWGTWDRTWPARTVIAASDWEGPAWFTPTPTTVPEDRKYHHDAASQRSLLKLANAAGSFAYQLIAHVSDTDRRLLPFKLDTHPGVPGWYYARSASDSRVNEIEVPLPWTTIRFPMPSPWLVVHGSVSDRTPAAYALNWSGQDTSMVDQEALRRQLVAELPLLDQFQRLYEDELDLTAGERLAAPVSYLTAESLRAALDAGPHFVSLSGHGNGGGCCGGSVSLASMLRNGPRGFIAYADSCLTNQFDSNDSFSEALLTNPSGGAVAYVGNTRFSWIGVGDDFQRAFFHRLATTRNLGLLNDSRLGVYGTTGAWAGYDLWAILTLNLLGDPELRVYRAPLPGIRILADLPRLEIHVDLEQPPQPPVPKGPPRPDPPPLRGIAIHVRAGERTFEAVTDETGTVVIPADLAVSSHVEITATHPDCVSARLDVAGAAPDWLTGRVVEIDHRPGGRTDSIVTLHTRDGDRRVVVSDLHPDQRLILDAVENALLSAQDISVGVLPTPSGDVVERFVLGGASSS